MNMQWKITANEDGYRISYILKQRGYSLSQRRRLRKIARVERNGIASNWDATVMVGDTITLHWDDPHPLTPWTYPLEIMYEDADFLVVNKPAGMLTHATASERSHTLLHAIHAYLNETRGETRPHPIHRLDRQTSGLIVIALNAKAQHDFMQSAFTNLQRSYEAIVTGYFPSPFADIRLPIARKSGSIIEREVNFTDGQTARTYIRRIAVHSAASRLQIQLATGRTHQIRVHLSHLGYPLLGDDLYGGSRKYITRQALHAFAITFFHPYSHRLIYTSCPCPADMQTLIDHFSLH